MKLTVKTQGEYGDREIDGPEARATLMGVLRKIGDHCILDPEVFPEDLIIKAKGLIKKRAVQALKGGNPIWDALDEHGNPAIGATILVNKPPIIGIIKEDGTWEKVGDGPDHNPFENREGKRDA